MIMSKCDDCGKIYEVTYSELTICEKCNDRRETIVTGKQIGRAHV